MSDGSKGISTIRKFVSLRVPTDVIYRALKDTRLEQLFPEYFIGVTRKLVIDKENAEVGIQTTTQDSPIQITEKFRLMISGNNSTNVEYVTETNVAESEFVVQSIVQTHVANILYSLLMLETGYINGLIKTNGLG